MPKNKYTHSLLALLVVIAVSVVGIGNSLRAETEDSSFDQPLRAELTTRELGGENQYIVSFKSGESSEIRRNAGFARSASVRKDEIRNSREAIVERNKDTLQPDSIVAYDNIPVFTASLSESDVQEIESDPLVSSVTENKVRFLSLNQSVPLINSDDVTNAGYGGKDTAIAILDTGVARHQFVNIVSDACYSNSGGFGGGFSVCPDGSSSSTADDSGDACDDISAGCDHGTHVAGIAAGNTNRTRVNLTTNLATVGSGNNVDVFVEIDTGDLDVSDFDLVLTYDSSQASFVSFSESTADGLTTTAPTSPSDGTIELSGTNTAGTVNGKDLIVGTITLTADGVDGSNIPISFARSAHDPTFTINAATQKPSLANLEIPITAADTAGSLGTKASAAYTGVAPEANIIAIQVFTEYSTSICNTFFGYSPCIGASDSDIIAGLNRVLALHNDSGFDYTVASVNMSLGGGLYANQNDCDAATGPTYPAVIQSLRDVQIPTIISSGNNGSSTAISAPACVVNAIAVGSTTISDTVSSFSNSNSLVELLAPGSSIISSVPGGSFLSYSGTSMASPHVAGAWAQLRQAKPTLSVDEALQAFQDEGVAVTDTRNNLTFDRIDTNSAYQDLTSGIYITEVDTETSEAGDTATVRFHLERQPTADVTIPLSLTDTSEGTLSGTTEIVITSGSWSSPASNEVTITGVDDAIADTDIQFQLITGDPTSSDEGFNKATASNLDDITIKNLDDESPTVWGNESTDITVAGDYDGDTQIDLAYWRPSTGQWNIFRSSDSSTQVQQWGNSSKGDIPVAGDFDGDNIHDFAVWRQSTGKWYILKSSNGGKLAIQWGNSSKGDIPVSADYDGDGKYDVAVWRQSTGKWYIIKSSNGGKKAVQWGNSSKGDVPVIADYTGDAKADVAVWRGNTGFWYIISSNNNSVISQMWGTAANNDTPHPADYDGDGKADITVWRSDQADWHFRNSATSTTSSINLGDETQNDQPVPADYDNDGKADPAMWRADTGEWLHYLDDQ